MTRVWHNQAHSKASIIVIIRQTPNVQLPHHTQPPFHWRLVPSVVSGFALSLISLPSEDIRLSYDLTMFLLPSILSGSSICCVEVLRTPQPDNSLWLLPIFRDQKPMLHHGICQLEPKPKDTEKLFHDEIVSCYQKMKLLISKSQL